MENIVVYLFELIHSDVATQPAVNRNRVFLYCIVLVFFYGGAHFGEKYRGIESRMGKR